MILTVPFRLVGVRMTVPGRTDKNSSAHNGDRWPSGSVAGAVLSAFAPACYGPSWVPWFRWVGAACVVVILVIRLHLVTGLSIVPLP